MKFNERRVYWIIIGVLVLLNLLQRSCHKPCPPAPVRTHTDTVELPTKDTSKPYKPVPTSTTRKPAKSSFLRFPTQLTPLLFDTSRDLQPIDTAFDVVSTYSDTLALPAPIRGYFIVQDTVDGTIRSRKYIRDFTVPITVNNTYTQANAPRTQLYVGAEVLGSRQTLLSYGGVNIGIKTKRDVFYEVKMLGPLQGGPPLFGFGVKTKISLTGR